MFCSSGSQHRSQILIVLSAFFLLASCQNKTATNSPPPRYAILRFENLSGDPTLEWVARAASESLPIMLAKALDGPVLGASSLAEMSPTLGPRPSSAPGISTGRAEAIMASANRIISGYLERRAGQIRITAVEENVSSGRTVRTVSAMAAKPADALERLAHALSPRAGRLPVTNPEALRDWTTALETPSAGGITLLEQATRLDPDAGPPWVALASVDAVRGEKAAAEETIAEARRHRIDDLSRARLDLADAEMNQNATAKIADMRRVVSLSPADLFLLRELADSEIAVGEFHQAAVHWKTLTDTLPSDPLAWNSLGYARSYAGDYTGAMSALREYERLRPQDANPSDSIGDLNYSFRKFTEAANNYMEAHKKQPAFEQYADLYKAAWAKFSAGDKAGADSLFAQFRTERLKADPSDALVLLLDADRLYRTGRQQQAISALQKSAVESKSAREQADIWAQLTIWELLAGDRVQAARDAESVGQRPPDAAAFVARFIAQPSASASEWEARAAHAFPLPAESGLRESALGYALLLDGKREAALPVWRQLTKSVPATDFFTLAIHTRLQGKPLERPLVPDPMAVNQFAAVLDKL